MYRVTHSQIQSDRLIHTWTRTHIHSPTLSHTYMDREVVDIVQTTALYPVVASLSHVLHTICLATRNMSPEHRHNCIQCIRTLLCNDLPQPFTYYQHTFRYEQRRQKMINDYFFLLPSINWRHRWWFPN